MFSRFANALYHAVDALAPPLPLQEDFIWHWKSVTKYYTTKNASNKLPIELTSIPGHLLEMLSLLEQEGKELEEGSIGPCMEYVMNHKLMETMCILGVSDAPSGMKRYMLIFVTRLLKTVQQFLIPHVSVYIPVTNFMKLCGEVLAAPTEKEEMDLLEVVCEKVEENPHLMGCFIGRGDQSKIPSVSLAKTSPEQQASQVIKENLEEYTLISSLLKLFFSPDKSISERACVCLKMCCSLVCDSAAVIIIERSDFCSIMCGRIVSLYTSLPKAMKLCEIEEPVHDSTDDGPREHKISADRRKFLCYLQHLSLIDTMIQDAHSIISNSLVSAFKKEFLDTVVYSDLVESLDIDENLFATTVISTSMRCISTAKLISAFEIFLLGDLQNFDIAGHSSHMIKDLLIERCHDTETNLALAMATLQLFEELLQRPSQFVLQNLIISCVENRGYFDHTAADDWLSFSDDDAGRYGNNDDSVLSSSPVNMTFAPPYIHRILDAFLSLLPDEMKSAETEEESGYETYIKEAHGRFMKCLLQCDDFDWPQEPLTREDYHLSYEDDSGSDSQPEAESSCWKFFEGPFLSMIFDKLEHMLDLPYDINLQVTSLASRLALFAHPNLHEYLLNPLIPVVPGVRSLFSVLLKVIEDIQCEVKGIKSFKQKLRLMRKTLLSDDGIDQQFEEANILEVLIVVEEFCKELAAIAFVKYNAVS